MGGVPLEALVAALMTVAGVGVLVVGVRALLTWARVRRPAGHTVLDVEAEAHRHAFAELMQARSRLSAAVEAQERAHKVVAAGADGGQAGGVADVAELDARVLRAQEALDQAQHRWEETAPRPAPASSVGLWAGKGVLVGWQLGPVGYEAFTLRLQHVLDPECWSTWQGRRFRWGFGLGVERTAIAAFALGATMADLPLLVRQGFGGAEVAVRPGFSLVRWVRLRSRNALVRRATAALRNETGDRQIHQPPSAPAREAVSEVFSSELGQRIESVTSLPEVDPQLSLVANGPAVLVGAWWGPTPHLRRVSSSGHTAWN